MGSGGAPRMGFGTTPSHWPTPHRTEAGWRLPSPEQVRLSPPQWASWSGWTLTRSLWRSTTTMVKRRRKKVGARRGRGRRSGFSLPDCVRNAAALFPAVSGQAAHQVRWLQAAAENRPHGAEQQQLAVISSRVTQSPAHFLHDLRRRGRLARLAATATHTHTHRAHTRTQLKRIEMLQGSSIKGLNGEKEMKYCHWLFSAKDIQKANPPKLLSPWKTKSKLSELFYKLAAYRLTVAH